MLRRLPAAPALLLAALLAAPPAARPEEPAEQARAVVDQMVATEGAGIWQQAERLAGMGPESLPAIKEKLGTAPPWARLGLARALLGLKENELARTTLLALLDPAQPRDVRIGAADQLGNAGLDPADRAAIAASIEKSLADELDPRVRVHAYRSLFALTKEPRWRRELEVSMRTTEDRNLKREAALLLADAGSVDAVKGVLMALRDEPTERGRLARWLLETSTLEECNAALRRENRDLRRKAEQAPSPAEAVPGAAPAPPPVPGFDAALLQAILAVLLKDADGAPPVTDSAAREAWVRERLEGAAHGLVTGFDPHTAFLDREEREEWNKDLIDKDYGGIGAYVDADAEDFFSIRRPMFGSPAWNAGLAPGDRILEIDGWSTVGKPVNVVITHLKGPAGTKVVVRVHRKGWTETRDMTLTRAQIHVPSSYSALLPGGVGFLSLEGFNAGADREIRSAVADLRRGGARTLVLDLRSNGGGLLAQAVAIASIFLPPGRKVVRTAGRAALPEEKPTHGAPGEVVDLPLAILVDGASASASEILAGALRFHGRATLVGERTFGKGSVQHVISLAIPPFCEPYTDADDDAQYDFEEEYEDLNRNGVRDERDPYEPYYDRNRNRQWDPGEAFEDMNRNGKFDCPAVKVTIARYFLPDGTSPERKKVKTKKGREIWKGGLEPDLAVKDEGLEGWRVEEAFRVTELPEFRDYLEGLFAKDPEKALALASSDGGDPAAYPGFDEFHAELKTPLSREDLRRVLRIRFRIRASDVLGRPLLGDFDGDAHLQRAILKVLEEAKVDPHAVPEYRSFADRTFTAPPAEEELLPAATSGEEGR